MVVRSNPDGSQVLLRDVARIELGSQNYLYKVRLDGQASTLIQVFQLPDANGLDVAEQVLSVMESIAQRFPDDVEYVVSLDTTKPITAGIREIVSPCSRRWAWSFLWSTSSCRMPAPR